MNAPRLLLPVLLALTVFQSQAAKPVKFAFTFRGTVYQTNGLGQVVASRITEQDLLQAAMTYYQVTDPNAAVLAYCITNNHFGDTISLINATTGAGYGDYMMGFFFGDDLAAPEQPIGRTALTNSPLSEVRRIDYLYTQFDSTWSTGSGHSMGASFTNIRYVLDGSGNVRPSFEGDLRWVVNPSTPWTGYAGTKVISGTFTTTKPLFYQ